jgi:signal transduction histidine kinase
MPSTLAPRGRAVVRPAAAPRLPDPAYAAYVAALTTRAPPAAYGRTMADRRVSWPDLGLTAALVVFALFGTGPAAANQGLAPAPTAAYALAVLACAPILVRRRWPAWTLALTGAITTVYIGLGYAYGPILLAMAVAGFAFAVRSPVRRVVAACAVLLTAGAVAVWASGRGAGELVSVAAWLLIPAAVGVAVKVRRDASADVRAEQARRAISEERLQLAQEVHDVVGHGLAVIAMQAGVALKVLDRDPAGARAAVEAIRATSREALDGLRAEIEALRAAPTPSDAPAREPSAAPLRPGVGLADVPRLVERIRSGGLTISVEVAVDPDGVPGGVPAEIDRAAYRIVQESLTNVLRHAGSTASARVRVVRDGADLLVEVFDDGRGGAGPPGHGITGMRDRARALGGTLEAGPRPGGGFAVRARLPVPASVPTRAGPA